MYLLVILLISPALGRPRSAQSSVGNKLEAVSEYPKGMSQLLKNSRLFGTVAEDLQQAKQNIHEMEEELESLASDISKLRNKDNYFQKFEEALYYIRLARKDLSQLAQRTQIEANKLINLLELFDVVPKPAILTRLIATMKSLMLETKEKLEDAREKYNSAHQVFDNLINSVAKQNGILDNTVKFMNAQYLENKAYTEKVRTDCQIAAVFTLGLCPLIHHFVNEVPLEAERVRLANIKKKSDILLGRSLILNRDIDDAIEFITKEIVLISNWAISAEVVSENIVDYPEESLRKYKELRTVFKNRLNALTIDAKNFVDHILSV